MSKIAIRGLTKFTLPTLKFSPTAPLLVCLDHSYQHDQYEFQNQCDQLD